MPRDGEIITPGAAAPERLLVVACPSPFHVVRVDSVVPSGGTLAAIVAHVLVRPILIERAQVWIDDHPILPEHWRLVRPKPGRRITIRVRPGMGGGSGGKSPLRIILSIAVIAASFVAGPLLGGSLALAAGFAEGATIFGTSMLASTFFGALVSGAVTMLGNLLVNAIAPPPRAALESASGLGQLSSTSPTLSITGIQNRPNPYGPVPRLFGRHRMFPPLGAAQYTEVVGNDQYFRALFDFGYGPLALEEFRIGTTPLDQFEGVEMEIRQGYDDDAPIALYSNQVVEDLQALKLTVAGGAQILETRDNADEITADITFQGLVHFGSSTAAPREATSVTLQAHYRLAGSADPWLAVVDWLRTAPSSAVTLTAAPAGAAYAEYRTDGLVGGPVNLQLVTKVTETVESANGYFNVFEIARYGYRVYSRAEGDAAWVLARTVAPAGDSAVALVGQNGKKMEIRIESTDGLVSTGTAPGFAAPSFSYPAQVAGDIVVTAATEQVVRHTVRIKPAARGRYEVRFTRITADNTDAQTRNDSYVTALRTIRHSPPTNVRGHCLVALRIKASDQLQGLIQTFNAIGQALLPVWDGLGWSAPQATRNNAWAALEILRGSANARPIADARIDLPAWLELAQACDVPDQAGEPKFRFDAVFDSRSTVLQAVNDVLATCRATLGFRDGKYSVVRDAPQSVPVQMFTPRNSWGFKATKQFVNRPHALKCRFVNPDKDWGQDEAIVYDDGYDAATATLFETVDMLGVTRASQAWRDGRYHFAVSKLRPEVYELSADIEHLVCKRGDLVRVAHDVPRFGASQGRIKAVATDGGGAITAITVDEVATLAAGTAYAVRVRNAKNQQTVAALAPVSVTTETTVLALAATIPAEAAAVGDLAAWGETSRETVELLVKSIRRTGDLSARLELIDAAPAVHQADTGTIPEFDTQSTWPAQGRTLAPAQPIVTGILSDEDAMVEAPGGGWQPAIRISFAAASGVSVSVVATEVQFRRSRTASDTARDAWETLRWPGQPSVIYVTGVDERTRYDIRIRAIGERIASDFVYQDDHLVVGRSTPPPAYDRVQVEGDLLVAAYPDPPRDFAGARIVYHRGINRIRAGAQSAHPGAPVVALPFDLSALPPGQLTVFLLAVDTSGNESDPAILVRDSDGAEIDNIITTVDLAALGFPGTITNGEIVDGVLRAEDDPTDLYLPNGSAPYLPVGGDPYLPAQYLAISYEFAVTPDPLDVPSQMTVATDLVAAGWTLEYRGGRGELYLPDGAAPYLPDGAAPYLGGPGDYGPFPSAIAASVARYEFRLSATAGQTRAVVNALAVRFDVPDQEEEIENLSIPAGGVRLPLTKAYRAIKHVGRTLEVDGGTAVTIKRHDLDPVRGPLVEAFDAAGASTSATADFWIKGIAA